MSDNVTYIRRTVDVAGTLRAIADQIEEGEISGSAATLIIHDRVYHMGPVSDHVAAANVVWDCNYAIAKLMAKALEE